MSMRRLRNPFQRRFQLDRYILEHDIPVNSLDVPINHQESSISSMDLDLEDPHLSPVSTSPRPSAHLFTPPSSLRSTVIPYKTPYFVSCFSPLELPPDLLIYFIKLLTPGDLWKLCQVSKKMQSAIKLFMSRSQRFGFEVIRILRQEHAWTDKQLLRVHHEKHYEDMRDHFWITYQQQLRITIPQFIEDDSSVQQAGMDGTNILNSITENAYAGLGQDPTQTMLTAQTQIENAVANYDHSQSDSSSAQTPPPQPSRGVIRSHYWVSQANFLFAAVLESSKGFFSSPIQNNCDQEMEGNNDLSAVDAAVNIDHRNDPAMGAFWTNQYETTKNISSPIAKRAMVDDTGRLKSLTKERFWSIVQVFFDSNLVNLAYRRAIINCARYVTAKFDSCFAYGLRIDGRVVLDTDYYDYDRREYSVNIGPHLALYPDTKSIKICPPKQSDNFEKLSIVSPPRRIQSTFQAMLWYRCLTDIIGVYNRIQELHNNPTIIGATANSFSNHMKNSEPTKQNNTCQSQQELFEQCRPMDSKFRKIIHHIRSIAKRHPYLCKTCLCRGVSEWSTPSSMPSSPIIHSHGALAKEPSCRYSHSSCSISGHHSHSQQQHCPSNQQDQIQVDEILHVEESGAYLSRQRAINLERDLLRRRIVMEERKERDTLLKEELLGLCHMACGLFMVRGQREPEQGGPRSIMTLLRQGSPWKQGVWREGEWRHAPIDLDHDVDETMMAHRFHLERDYKHLKSTVFSNRNLPFLNSSFQSTLSTSSAYSDSSESLISLTTLASSNPSTTSLSSNDSGESNDISDANVQEGNLHDTNISEPIALLLMNAATKEDDTIDQGSWQSLCLATIKFLTEENLTWGGNDPNHELSKLKATLHEGAWHYHE
ncbi:hypothetical protein FBU30_000651 [Linnemannia zychae]|nr:hypothetical protein FBU30_000651 [Linnemannia zychae]